MRVILTQPVLKLGEVGDLCEVAPGYGRNYLIPQGFAVQATRGALKQVDDLKRTEARRQHHMRSELEVVADKIESARLSFTAKVGETGRLYGLITSSDIAEQLESQIGLPVDRRKILLDEPIRTLGDHEMPIHLMPGLNATVHVRVDPDAEMMLDVGLTDEVDDVSEQSIAEGAHDHAPERAAADAEMDDDLYAAAGNNQPAAESDAVGNDAVDADLDADDDDKEDDGDDVDDDLDDDMPDAVTDLHDACRRFTRKVKAVLGLHCTLLAHTHKFLAVLITWTALRLDVRLSNKIPKLGTQKGTRLSWQWLRRSFLEPFQQRLGEVLKGILYVVLLLSLFYEVKKRANQLLAEQVLYGVMCG